MARSRPAGLHPAGSDSDAPPMAAAPTPDQAPATSYSDPFYDRLDAMSQRIKRQWILIIVLLVAAIAGGAVLTAWLRRNPEAAAYNRLFEARGDIAALTTLADDAGLPPGIRIDAAAEAVQLHLMRKDTAAAMILAERTLALARANQEAPLTAGAQLSLAAVHEQAGRIDEAKAAYQTIERASNLGQHTHLRLIAAFGVARIAEAQSDLDTAINALETHAFRTESHAQSLARVARTELTRLRLARSLAAPAGSATRAPGT